MKVVRDIPLRERHIGQPILWQPSAEQEHQLRQDWEELMDYIVLRKVEPNYSTHW